MLFKFLREYSTKCGDNFTGLDVYLNTIFPDVDDWIHDKRFPGLKINEKPFLKRPDYRSETLKLIVEFDGMQHYQNPDKIVGDEETSRIYEKLGFEVVRIPFFIQLTNEAVKTLFGVDVETRLFDGNTPSLGIQWKNTPAYLCPLGIKRMAKELIRFPEQLAVNIKALEDIEDDRISGLSVLKAEIERI